MIERTNGTVLSDWSVVAFIYNLLLLLDVNVCVIQAQYFFTYKGLELRQMVLIKAFWLHN